MIKRKIDYFFEQGYGWLASCVLLGIAALCHLAVAVLKLMGY